MMPETTNHKTVIFNLPIRVRNLLNERVHWRTRARYNKQIREPAMLFAQNILSDVPKPKGCRYVVTLTRHSRTAKKMDCDGLQAAMKPVRDGIADALGIDDGSERIEWKYGEKKTGEYAVEVMIEVQP